MKNTLIKQFLIIVIYFSLILNISSSESEQKKNHISIQRGKFNLVVVDEYMNFKAYDGSETLPFKLNYIRTGDKFTHFLNFFMADITLNTVYSDDLVQYDYIKYSGGELSYRMHYKIFDKSNFSFSAGSGILSTGNMKSYYKSYEFYGISFYDQSRVPDITAGSLLLGANIRFKNERSLIMAGFDLPVLNYYLRPSARNVNRSNYRYQYSEWHWATLDKYVAGHTHISFCQRIFRYVYFNASWQLDYQNIKNDYPVKSLNSLLAAGFSINF